MIMPASLNRSNCAFRYDLRRLATMPTAKSGLKPKSLETFPHEKPELSVFVIEVNDNPDIRGSFVMPAFREKQKRRISQ
jgi:hypothetical protein